MYGNYSKLDFLQLDFINYINFINYIYNKSVFRTINLRKKWLY